MRMNRIIARGVSGMYKDKDIKVEIGETAEKSSVKVNGKDVSGIFGVHIHIRIGKPTTLVLEKYKVNFK